jgi:hypothetical protein
MTTQMFPKSPTPSGPFALAIGLLILALVLVLSSCSTQHKIEKAKGFLEEHGRTVVPTNKLDSTCAALFPVEEEVTFRAEGSDSTAFLREIDSLRAVLSQMDSTQQALISGYFSTSDTACKRYALEAVNLRAQVAGLRVRLLHLPAIHDTVRLETKVRDRAFEQSLQDENNTLQGQLAESETSIAVEKQKGTDAVKAIQTESDRWKRRFFIACGIVLLFAVWTFRGLVPGLKLLKL